ncbi:MAG: hypothetical protein J5819_09635 [Eubacterium sp.]|nr:hypothetical protein [Eubacterium sp.]
MTDKRNYIILWVLTGIIIILGIGGLMVFSYFYNNQCYEKYQVVTEVERSDSNNGLYQYFQKNLLKYSGSGISLINSVGKTLWNGGFEMKQAQVDTCGKQVLAVDVGGTEFNVYNGQDEGIRTETTYPIVRGKVSEQGVAAILEQDIDSNSLKLYNPYSNTTKLIAEIPTNVSEDGYPLDYDISPDGKTVVAAYMTVKGTESEYHVNFFNFSDVGQDRNILVGGREYGAEMVSQIRFLDNERVVIYREKGFDIYENMKQPKPSLEKTFDRVILSIADSDEYIGVITTDGARTDKRLQVFTVEGEVVLEQPIDYEYADFRIYGEEIYFYRTHHVDILRMNGTPKFRSDFDADITGVFPGGRSIEYIIVDNTSIRRIRMKAR